MKFIALESKEAKISGITRNCYLRNLVSNAKLLTYLAWSIISFSILIIEIGQVYVHAMPTLLALRGQIIFFKHVQ